MIMVSTLLALKVSVYTERNNKPFSYYENGVAKGIHVDLLKSIFSRIQGYAIELEATPLHISSEKIKNDEILVLYNSFYNQQNGLDIAKHTNPILYQDVSIYCNKEFGNDKIEWPTGFTNLTVAKNNNFSVKFTKKYFDIAATNKITLIDVNSTSNGLLALSDKHVECYIGDDIAIKSELRKLIQTTKESHKFEKIKKITTIAKGDIYLGFSDNYFPYKDDMIKKINLAIKSISHSDEIQDIIDENLEQLVQLKKQEIKAAIYNWGFYTSDQLKNYGPLSEVVTAAFAYKNIKVNYEFINKKTAYLFTKWGKTCMSFPWSKSGDIESYMYFSDPLMATKDNFFYKKSKFPHGIVYANDDDLRKYRIGGISGYAYEEIFYKKDLNYKSYKSFKELIDALLLEEIDIVPSNIDVFHDDLQEYFPNRMNEFSYQENLFTDSIAYIMFSKHCENSYEMKKAFDEGLQAIKKSGALRVILNKYHIKDEDYKYMFERVNELAEQLAEYEDKSKNKETATQSKPTLKAKKE